MVDIKKARSVRFFIAKLQKIPSIERIAKALLL
jgi:hypothetical protein